MPVSNHWRVKDDVRFGSKADVTTAHRVRPQSATSGHALSGVIVEPTLLADFEALPSRLDINSVDRFLTVLLAKMTIPNWLRCLRAVRPFPVSLVLRC